MVTVRFSFLGILKYNRINRILYNVICEGLCCICIHFLLFYIVSFIPVIKINAVEGTGMSLGESVKLSPSFLFGDLSVPGSLLRPLALVALTRDVVKACSTSDIICKQQLSGP